MPKIGAMEMPAAIQEMADKGIAQATDTLQNAKAATEEATNLLQHAYTAAAKGATDYNLKVIEIARTRANAFRNDDGANQGTCRTGSDRRDRDRRAAQERNHSSVQ